MKRTRTMNYRRHSRSQWCHSKYKVTLSLCSVSPVRVTIVKTIRAYHTHTALPYVPLGLWPLRAGRSSLSCTALSFSLPAPLSRAFHPLWARFFLTNAISQSQKITNLISYVYGFIRFTYRVLIHYFILIWVCAQAASTQAASLYAVARAASSLVLCAPARISHSCRALPTKSTQLAQGGHPAHAKPQVYIGSRERRACGSNGWEE